MLDRRFTEIELRRMLAFAYGLRRDAVPGRWVVATRPRSRRWEVVVEPDFDLQLLVIVTAYPL